VLPAACRLRSNRQFRLVFARGRSYVHPLLVLYVRRSGSGGPRIGFSIGKKLGGAVERNRIRRRLREICRARLNRLRPGFDLVFVGRRALAAASFHTIQQVMDELLGQARLWSASSTPEKFPCGEPPPD
jgi:ribonuclease P protein component